MSSASRKFRLAEIVLTTVLLVGSSAVKLSHAQAANPGMSESPVHGKKLAETHCASCHGVDGNSADPQFPKIAGQNPDYIRLQLHAFKDGARASPIMSAPASALTNEQIAELARYFSDQPVKPNVVKDTQLARVGSRIFNEPSRDAPPCVACHGQGGFGPGGMTGDHMGITRRPHGNDGRSHGNDDGQRRRGAKFVRPTCHLHSAATRRLRQRRTPLYGNGPDRRVVILARSPNSC